MRIGIDPGKTGAIVILEKEKEPKIYVIPTIKNELDIRELVNIFDNIFKESSDIHVVIEDVHAIFGASAGATFEFGKICGILEGMLACYKVPYTKIQPKIWQKEMWIGVSEVRNLSKINKNGKESKGRIDTKAMSLIAAKRLFPNVKLTDPKSSRATKPHSGIFDALLIAEYCKRKF